MVKAFELQINRVISIIFFCFIYFSQTLDSKFCYWSKATAAIVKSCPKTRLDVEKRAKLKNCQALALTQNCTTEPRKFKYHCVMNEYENAFVEVCATEYYIHGMFLN